ncbi:hypothetical protein HID58_052664 [Brassica napus]|uniref:Uncharacterized protein n=1 Tax=Brassica napus TaxID=3708 RepID=A0ABQ8ACG9_BRANA|nr:hypothetical protein HID58_052664 [Brassica napus]
MLRFQIDIFFWRFHPEKAPEVLESAPHRLQLSLAIPRRRKQPEFEDGFNENAEDLATTMLELWNLMDTPIEEQQEYQHITCNIAASEHEITQANTLWLMIKEAEEKTMGELYTLCLVSGEQGEYIYCPRVHQWWKAFWQNCEFISAVHYCYSRRLYHKDLKVQQRFSNSWAQVHTGKNLFLDAQGNLKKLLKDGFIIRKPTKIHSPEEILKVKED